jgi:adenylate cyclase
MVAGSLNIGDRQFPLVGKTFSLGRAKDNNIVFSSNKVSRRHALVHAQGGSEFSLVDLGSSNGTHLNGRRVIHPLMLQDGDVIQIGEESMVFRLENMQTPEEQCYQTETQLTVREVNEITCWFLVMDIENFVQLSSERPTEELARTVGSWLAECQRVIESHGGALSKFLGDGVLVYWNARFSEPASVAAALTALRTMQLHRQPPFRWALHFGTAAFGAASAPGELSAIGQDLNFLFRLERVAAENNFPSIISDTAHSHLKSILGAQPLGCFPIKGFPGKHSVFGCDVSAPSPVQENLSDGQGVLCG